MELFFRFAYMPVLYIGSIVLIMATWYRCFRYKTPFYVYPITNMIFQNVKTVVHYKKIIHFLRFLTLAGLLLLSARPQLVDQQSNINVQGVDIMMAIDVSGSMQLFDDLDLRDDTGKLQTLVTANQNGVISNVSLIEAFGLDADQEIERLRFEQGANFVQNPNQPACRTFGLIAGTFRY